MDQLIGALIRVAVAGVTAVVKLIADSAALSEEQKKAHLADLSVQLVAANAEVAAVKFKDV